MGVGMPGGKASGATDGVPDEASGPKAAAGPGDAVAGAPVAGADSAGPAGAGWCPQPPKSPAAQAAKHAGKRKVFIRSIPYW